MLCTTGLYNGIFCVLSSDNELLSLLEVNLTGDEDEVRLNKALKMQKRSKPKHIADSLPMLSFYTSGGKREDENSEVYNPVFYFDIYTNDNPDSAHRIADRIFTLFENKIPAFGGGIETYTTKFVDSYEIDSDMPDTYGFCIMLEFSTNVSDE